MVHFRVPPGVFLGTRNQPRATGCQGTHVAPIVVPILAHASEPDRWKTSSPHAFCPLLRKAKRKPFSERASPHCSLKKTDTSCNNFHQRVSKTLRGWTSSNHWPLGFQRLRVSVCSCAFCACCACAAMRSLPRDPKSFEGPFFRCQTICNCFQPRFRAENFLFSKLCGLSYEYFGSNNYEKL